MITTIYVAAKRNGGKISAAADFSRALLSSSAPSTAAPGCGISAPR
ncbi:MAG TPA: hypothetical protein VGW34_08155 [Allosphingosinicella sp.]|nr:hypothetical protein [Allosphingosinicella sp.]